MTGPSGISQSYRYLLEYSSDLDPLENCKAIDILRNTQVTKTPWKITNLYISLENSSDLDCIKITKLLISLGILK